MHNIIEEIPVNGCFAVKCDNCGKTTWKGCGNHVESVMSGIKEENRCECARKSERESEFKSSSVFDMP
ncbi:hypothetical protein BGW80DRAFT_1175986 [Lactifluus volemus]|nr:hypothetical protein BGW80DRAFT_1175986 [Lactifluus volemus]